jgi:hypothetical protein
LIPSFCFCQDSTLQITKNDLKNISGIWYLPSFIDSSIINKRICEYATPLTMFVYQIIIKEDNPDSCFVQGTWENRTLLLKKIGDDKYITYFGPYLANISIENKKGISILKFKMFIKNHIDSTDYIFVKREIKIDNIEEYFVSHILSGKYIDSTKDITIEISDNMKVTGLDSLTHFYIGLNNSDHDSEIDHICFNRDKPKGQDYKDYHWKIINNHLMLYEISWDYNEFSKKQKTIESKIGKLVYDFKKIK